MLSLTAMSYHPRSITNNPKYRGSRIISESLLKSEALYIKYTKHQKAQKLTITLRG